MRYGGASRLTIVLEKAHANKKTTCSVCNIFAINVFLLRNALRAIFSLVLTCRRFYLASSCCSVCRVTEVTTCTPFSRLSVSCFQFDVILAKFLDRNELACFIYSTTLSKWLLFILFYFISFYRRFFRRKSHRLEDGGR